MNNKRSSGDQGLIEITTGLKHKVQRFATSLLPVADSRRGECNRCGQCCKLPFPCPFLRFDDQGLSSCAVYHARPPSCRKYPRTSSENLTPATCGYYFVEPPILNQVEAGERSY